MSFIERNPAPARPTTHLLSHALALGLIYFALALLAIHFAKQPDAITNVWFANAAAMAMFASTSRARWPKLLLVMVVANVAANIVYRNSVVLSLSFIPGNVVEVLTGAWLLQRDDLWQDFGNDATAFVRMLAAGAVVPELLGATIGACTLQLHGFATFHDAWLDWYVGSVLGATAALPAMLAFVHMPNAQVRLQLTTPAFLTLLVVTIAFGLLVLHYLPHPLVYLELPLIAAAFLVTPLAALTLCFVVVLVVTAAIAYAILQPMVVVAEWQTVLMFAPVIAVLIPAQLLAVLMERKRILVETLSTLNAVSSDVMAFLDRQGVMHRVNRAYEEYWNCSGNDVLGRPIDEVIPAHMLPDVKQSFERALAGNTVRAQATLDFPGRGKQALDVCYEPARDTDGQILGVVFAGHDVTDLVTARVNLENTISVLTERTEALAIAKQRAESADRLKSAFLTNMSHELRTPLNSVIGFTGILLQELAGPLTDEQRKQLLMVQGSARHLLALISDVLDLSKIESDKLDVQFERFDLHVTIDKVIEAVAPLAQKKGLALRAEIATGIGTVSSDSRRVEQVLLNLLGNAIKFTERGAVTLVATVDPRGVLIRISDTGIGIKREDLPILFRPFSRIDSDLVRSSEGTGLGLVICRRLAELLGGEVTLESEWGKGTVVSFTLPIEHLKS
jgi:PAS domain S-box-containing protein